MSEVPEYSLLISSSWLADCATIYKYISSPWSLASKWDSQSWEAGNQMQVWKCYIVEGAGNLKQRVWEMILKLKCSLIWNKEAALPATRSRPSIDCVKLLSMVWWLYLFGRFIPNQSVTTTLLLHNPWLQVASKDPISIHIPTRTKSRERLGLWSVRKLKSFVNWIEVLGKQLFRVAVACNYSNPSPLIISPI